MNKNRRSKPIGSVALLGWLQPWSVLMLTILLSTVMVGVLRVITEGTYYDRSLASRPGDALLGLYLATASWIIRGDGSVSDEHPSVNIEDSWLWHCAIAIAGLLAGVVLQLRAMTSHGNHETPANTYHNLVVVSVLTYLVISVIPVVVKARQRSAQIVAVIGALGWMGLLIWDIKMGNLQRNG